MNYQQALDYIDSYTDYEKIPMPHDPAFYDLRRVELLLSRLGSPHLGAKTVHIAGTKGKGSTAAMVASALATAGYTTGLYTSPHLNTLRERFRVDGEMIAEGELVSVVERLKPEVEAINEEAVYGELTTFELLTALAFAFFNLKGVDFQVLEVGLGGKYDATNIILPEVCVITSISLDHTDVLGDSLTQIAAEKAGIIKPGVVVVLSPQADEVVRVVEEVCLRQGVELVRVGRDVTWRSLGFDHKRQSLEVRGRLGSYRMSIPLLGQYQLGNATTAVAVLEVLAAKGFNISRDSIINGLEGVSWVGRFQVLGHQPLLVVDGAHNPDSAQKLRQSLVEYFDFDRAILVTGVSCDKDIDGIVSELVPLFDRVIVTRAHHPRSMALEQLAAAFQKNGVEVQAKQNVPAALSLAMSTAGAGDLVCVTGSLFVVAEAIEQSKLMR